MGVALVGATATYAASGDDAGLDLRKGMALSARDMATQSKEQYRKMLEVRQRVTSLRDKARKDKDVVKLNCVGDKLVQVNGHLVVADQSMSALNGAIIKGDDGARQHEFTRIAILSQKVNTLGTEAEQCVGEDVSYVGATTVDVEIDPSIPNGDPTQPALPVPIVERPPEASPFV